MSRSLSVALALAILSLAVAAPAHAILITVTVSDKGTFSFDSSIIPTGGGTVGDLNLNDDYSTSLSIADNLGGVWDSGNAGVNYLKFDAQGNLTEWALGGDVNGVYNDIFALNSAGAPYYDDLQVSVLGGSAIFRTTHDDSNFQNSVGWFWSFSPQPPYTVDVPEPGTLALFAPGLLALGLIRRRKR